MSTDSIVNTIKSVINPTSEIEDDPVSNLVGIKRSSGYFYYYYELIYY